jgi:hypothetical protein
MRWLKSLICCSVKDATAGRIDAELARRSTAGLLSGVLNKRFLFVGWLTDCSAGLRTHTPNAYTRLE